MAYLQQAIMGSEYYLLYITDERFRMQPCEQDGTPNQQACLTIDRVTGEVSVEPFEQDRSYFESKILIRGLFGIINLLAGPYLIVIRESEIVATINQQKIYRVTKTDVLPYCRSTAHLSKMQLADNLLYLEMVNTVLSFEHFYYSPTFDITHTMQRLNNTTPEFLSMSLRERADSRFVWNGALLKELTMAYQAISEDDKRICNFPDFAIPVMLGFVECREVEIGGRKLKLSLISRRSCHRAGVRYQTRGIDAEGNAANFIETEQIVEFDNLLCSFVQTRGSVPIFWSQKPNLRWQPWPSIEDTNHQQGFRYHIFSQSYTYGRQVLISLLNQKGREKEVADKYERIVKECDLADVKYVPIDFNEECGSMNWYKINLITNKLLADLKRHGYFAINKSESEELSSQTGVFRTNCMDCLDRTNVVQSLIGLRCLEIQLENYKVLRPDETLQSFAEFTSIYKNLWADNGDVCSTQYAGTGALKSDFTRTGERTPKGCLRDGCNAVFRWYINNFTDGFRQDAIDLFVGGFCVNDLRGMAYSRTHKSMATMMIPACFVFANCMMLLSFFFYTDNGFFSLLFWMAVSGTLTAYIFTKGETLADVPKLKRS